MGFVSAYATADRRDVFHAEVRDGRRAGGRTGRRAGGRKEDRSRTDKGAEEGAHKIGNGDRRLVSAACRPITHRQVFFDFDRSMSTSGTKRIEQRGEGSSGAVRGAVVVQHAGRTKETLTHRIRVVDVVFAHVEPLLLLEPQAVFGDGVVERVHEVPGVHRGLKPDPLLAFMLVFARCLIQTKVLMWAPCLAEDHAQEDRKSVRSRRLRCMSQPVAPRSTEFATLPASAKEPCLFNHMNCFHVSTANNCESNRDERGLHSNFALISGFSFSCATRRRAAIHTSKWCDRRA
mmetsp:Transcript_6358/g.19788  ORF Transcript_6358/g.19788 Transcript_6358/m.19788 type:complete len:290 (+) Transcript_6358:1672-2541(+)